MDDLTKVYFQNEHSYDFHYNFAIGELSPFAGMDLTGYNQATLFETGRVAVLGTVLLAPNVNEYAIQFVAADVLPREMVRFLYETVDAAITKPVEYRGFYVPTYEQAQLAGSEPAYFAVAGIEIADAGRWSPDEGTYAEGWGLGRLVYVEATNLVNAYAAGQLLSTDILLIDEIPAEVPYVAGIISLAPATPNSHVAILADSYGIPFVYVSNTNTIGDLNSWLGLEIVLRASDSSIKLLDVDGISSVLKDEILLLKEPAALEVAAKQAFGGYSTNVTDLTPADIVCFGGKASNYGFLRRVVPENSREAMAFSFDLWDDYLDQVLPGTNTLRQEINSRLAGYAYPPDMQALSADLAYLRDLITDTADVNSAQTNEILTVLGVMFTNLNLKIRFRSSTNVEDSEYFSGAGLYDSYSGCLMDDLDGDDVGPCYCDPSEPNERGVFRAMRKVFASFYNGNAFVERLRRGVNESEVGMAVLVHHNFEDADELANGVANAVFTYEDPRYRLNTGMVSQPGDVSVTNPDGTELPEIVSIDEYRNGFLYSNLVFEQQSELLDLGETYVLDWQQDYYGFQALFFDVGGA